MDVRVRLLGDFVVWVDDRAVPAAAFARRDAAALAKLLALRPARRLHREQVMDFLWPDAPADVAANRLHKAAHYVRRATGARGSVVLDSNTVVLFPDADVTVDVDTFESLATEAIRAADAVLARRTLEHYGGELLPADVYEPWTFHPRQRLAVRHRDLLRTVGDVDQLIVLDPTDEQAHLAVMQRMLERGDRAGVHRQYELLRHALEAELGIGPSAEADGLLEQAVSGAPVQPSGTADRYASIATQVVHRCSTPDGIRLAYATSGDGPPLVKASNWLTHLDYDWHSPVWRHWWQALSRTHTLIRYDERGSGLSDWEVDAASYTLEAWVRDLETIVDALDLERFALLGMSQGGPIAITYAARHPERVSHVVVYGTCARATWEHASEERRQELAALGQLIRVSWGQELASFRQVYDAKFLPDGPVELWRAFDELQRRSTSARNAFRLWRAFGALDCADAARRLQVPTLILHSKDDQVWSYDEAVELQAMVAGSRLVALDSRNHILQADEPAFAHFLEEVENFLAT